MTYCNFNSHICQCFSRKACKHIFKQAFSENLYIWQHFPPLSISLFNLYDNIFYTVAHTIFVKKKCQNAFIHQLVIITMMILLPKERLKYLISIFVVKGSFEGTNNLIKYKRFGTTKMQDDKVECYIFTSTKQSGAVLLLQSRNGLLKMEVVSQLFSLISFPWRRKMLCSK